MLIEVELPKAFSVRDENEFFPIQHLMARLNPDVMVVQVATGMHVKGGCTVFWGLIYLESRPIGRAEVEDALKEAGFDFIHASIQLPDFVTEQSEDAHTQRIGISDA